MGKNRGRLFVFPRLTECRENAGLSLAAVVREAGIDRGTLTRMEEGGLSRKETLMRVGNALNDLHYAKRNTPLNLDAEIVVGTRPQSPAANEAEG
jgi:transcriptional regulator with XRE-family HTH domain